MKGSVAEGLAEVREQIRVDETLRDRGEDKETMREDKVSRAQ